MHCACVRRGCERRKNRCRTALTALRGGASEVRHFADHIIAERGVRYGRVVVIPTGEGKQAKVHRPG